MTCSAGQDDTFELPIAMAFQPTVDIRSKFQPDIVKLDMQLIRAIYRHPVKRAIVRNTLQLLRDLGITPICEGIETIAELHTLRDLGVDIMQGFRFAEPVVGRLPAVILPASPRTM